MDDEEGNPGRHLLQETADDFEADLGDGVRGPARGLFARVADPTFRVVDSSPKTSGNPLGVARGQVPGNPGDWEVLRPGLDVRSNSSNLLESGTSSSETNSNWPDEYSYLPVLMHRESGTLVGLDTQSRRLLQMKDIYMML